MSTVRRIIDFIEFSGMSKREFYKKTHLSNGYLDKVKEFGSDKIESIISIFPELNLQWVITGKGYMLKQKADLINLPDKSTADKIYPPEAEPSLADANTIPVFINPSLGGTESEALLPDYYMHIPEYANCYACKIYTDTLINIIPVGSYIFIREVSEWKQFLENGRSYELRLIDGRNLHYIIERSFADGNLLLVPQNNKLQAFELPRDIIRSIWIICGFMPPPIV